MLYLRGLVPEALAACDPPAPSSTVLLRAYRHVSCVGPLRLGTYFTDGSGGRWSSVSIVRRVALALAGLAWTFDPSVRRFPE